MIRTLLCAILLGTACQATANTLYKWTEADGSITFSPEPPAAGIAYDTVQTGSANPAPQRPLPQQAVTQNSLQAPNNVTRNRVTAAAPTEPAQDLAYAPAAAALPDGIAWENPQDTANHADQLRRSGGSNSGLIGSTQKNSQCQDLEKRVMSLERRLRSKLTPDEVDNTVVAIVRYQNNFDQFCE